MKIFSNKRGLELSIGLVVVFILSIIIFSMAVYLVFKWFAGAEQIKAEIDKQTEEQIVAALRTGNTLVAIPIAVRQTQKGDAVNFGMGVKNVGQEGDFSAAIRFSGAFLPNGNPIFVDEDYVNTNWLGNFNIINTFRLKKNEQKLVPIQIRAYPTITTTAATPKGDYVFNVCVYDKPLQDDRPWAECSARQYEIASGNFYTGKIYQVTVRVV
jgi:hypothetical protein